MIIAVNRTYHGNDTYYMSAYGLFSVLVVSMKLVIKFWVSLFEIIKPGYTTKGTPVRLLIVIDAHFHRCKTKHTIYKVLYLSQRCIDNVTMYLVIIRRHWKLFCKKVYAVRLGNFTGGVRGDLKVIQRCTPFLSVKF